MVENGDPRIVFIFLRCICWSDGATVSHMRLFNTRLLSDKGAMLAVSLLNTKL